MTSTIKVDTISENTSANGVAIDGVTLKDGGITATGNTGIGEASPDTRLHVTETINVAYSADNFTVDANSLLKLENPSTTGAAFSAIQFRTGSGADLFFGGVQGSGNEGAFIFARQGSPDLELINIAHNGATTITTADNTNTLSLISTDADATSGPRLSMRRESSSPADNDSLAQIFFTGKDAGGNNTDYASLLTTTKTVADGSENGLVTLNVMSGGTAREFVRFQGSYAVVFNEDSQDIDFRVESNGNTHMLFVDGGSDHVNIGTSSDLGGTLNVEGTSVFRTTGNENTLSLISTDADASAGPILRLARQSASPADGDTLGAIQWQALDDGAGNNNMIQIIGSMTDASAGSEDATLYHYQTIGGATVEMVRYTPTGPVFNEGSADLDFRVESDGDANALFVDAGNDRVGFFTNSPDNQIDLKRAGSAIMKIESTNNGDDAKLLIKKAGSSSRNMVGFVSDNTWHVGHLRNATTTFSIATNDDSNSSNEFRVTSSGVLIAGSLSKGSGSFKIEHPHPDKKDTHNLVHSFVEAPQADNIYRGKVDLVNGTAQVNIDSVADMTDGTFVLLNTNVQCFTSNESGWTAVKGSVSGNILTITAEDNSCTDTISWMVVGERHDQHMKDTDWTDVDGKVIVEPLKEIEEVE